MADQSLIDLYREAFPAVDAATRARFKSFLASKETDHKWLYSPTLRNELSQGDILIDVKPFFFDGLSVKLGKLPCPFILLEHSCDIQLDNGIPRNETCIFSPLIDFELIKGKFKEYSAIEKNKITHKIFFANVPMLNKSYVADLDMISSLKVSWLHESLSNGSIQRVSSLTDNGFLFLLAKLTVHLMRYDSSVDLPYQK